jgi:hypothetical protein
MNALCAKKGPIKQEMGALLDPFVLSAEPGRSKLELALRLNQIAISAQRARTAQVWVQYPQIAVTCALQANIRPAVAKTRRLLVQCVD